MLEAVGCLNKHGVPVISAYVGNSLTLTGMMTLRNALHRKLE